jgi:DNA-binding GntR family transcriptional regulator
MHEDGDRSGARGGHTQTDRATALLRAQILTGGLSPGERLRAADLRQRFGLGLTPMREALNRLFTEGLVEIEPHQGPRVTDASAAELADLMAARRDIERLCLTRAMAAGDADWEAEIVAALHLLSRTALPAGPDDTAAAAVWEARHRRFHVSLIAACDSAWLKRFWATLADHSERYRTLRLLHHHTPAARVRDVNAEHQAIAAAVLARDEARAVALIDAHLRATEAGVAALLADGIGAAGR